MTWTRISTRRQRWTAAVSCVAALGLLAACGDDADGDSADVASLGTAAPDGGADTNSAGDADGGTEDGGDEGRSDDGSADPQEAMLAYSECMRDHGIDMPDPEFSGGGGGFVVGGGPASEGEDGAGIDPRSEEFQAAEEECSPLLEDAIGSIEVDPEQEAEMREQMLAFAECMREHGVDMPDPQFDSGGRVEVQVGSADEQEPMDVEAMEDASEACSEELGGGPLVFGAGE